MAESDRSSQGATILVIEDDDLAATDVHTGLTRAGYLVLRAASADEALHTLESTQAELILMSLMLPGTDGLILCSTLKTRFDAPIILLSGHAGEVDRALALESGAVALLTTPIDVDELLSYVQSIVHTPVSSQACRR